MVQCGTVVVFCVLMYSCTHDNHATSMDVQIPVVIIEGNLIQFAFPYMAIDEKIVTHTNPPGPVE